MNQINAFNAGVSLTPSQVSGARALTDVALKLATGVNALFSNPLGAGQHAHGKMLNAWSVRCGSRHDCIPPRNEMHIGHNHHHEPKGFFERIRHHNEQRAQRHDIPRCGTKPFVEPKPIQIGGCFPPPKPGCWDLPEPKVSWTAKMTGENTAKIDLGDGYKLDINEKNSEMTIINEKTGEKTKIWGDPHVDVDGKRAFDFWGTSTFTLENGTKITINTEQWNGNPNAYVASQVFITKGDNAIVVDGISQNKIGDLSVTMSNNGEEIDAANRDGWTLHENATGSGWRTENGNVATQKDADVTRIGAEYGPGSTALSQAEAAELGFNFDFSQMANQIASYLLFGAIVGSMIDMFSGSGSNNNFRADDGNKPRDFIPIRRFDSVLP